MDSQIRNRDLLGLKKEVIEQIKSDFEERKGGLSMVPKDQTKVMQ